MKLFVGGISQDTTEEHLRDYFQSFGPISRYHIVYDKSRDGNKGYAFLECDHERTATRILEVKLHCIQGRKVVVTEALGKKKRQTDEDISRCCRRLFVGGLVPKCTSDDLHEYFGQFGEISNSYVILDPHTGESKKFGYVEFVLEEDAQNVLNQPAHFLLKKQISVQPTKNKMLSADTNDHEGRNTHKQTSFTEKATLSFPLLAEDVPNCVNTPTYRPLPGYIEDSTVFNNIDTTYFINPFPTGEIEFYEPQQFCTGQFDPNSLPEDYTRKYKENWVPENDGSQKVNSQAPKSKRLFKLFYKQLKRPHIRARTTRKQEGNYVFHVSNFTPSYFSIQLAPLAFQEPRRHH